ncbi:MAG TPA: acetyl-CoA carboxylase biotin carboxyl carrier protein subunit [Ignavibacteriales bacterium]|nr:acetyl-CoA carboxylase biotin carboxyl carrier protein subunit [Ignavibacteriales bacterium]HOL81242.1 acetyl-CoA carboxylase biotin carboxyl carrier protein subunit [Ignavibacteriales bacterium]HPP33353.1 acetyl-CoA carboxylase biotin carboxyl carrier protein subunit [Ignavibacteriales bacterium]
MKKYNIVVNGNSYDVEIVSFTGANAVVNVNGETFNVDLPQQVTSAPAAAPKPAQKAASKPAAAHSTTHDANVVVAPIPGTILKVLVKPGDSVTAGQEVVILEAMKMENILKAEKSGKVKAVKVNPGDTVMEGDVLVEIE